MNDLTLGDLLVLQSWADVMEIEDQMRHQDHELLDRIQTVIEEKREIEELAFDLPRNGRDILGLCEKLEAEIKERGESNE